MDAHRTAEERDAGPLDEQRADRLSRFLAMVLRHRAYQFDLPMDDFGFVPIADLLEVIREQHSLDWVEREHLEFLAGRGERKRFEIRDDHMRATYGHSFRRLIRYEPEEPPETLYAPIPGSQVGGARTNGLRPEGRQYVHLSETRAEAEQVARRREQETRIVTVRAREAFQDGIPFYHPTEGLYLVQHLPGRYVQTETRFGRRPRKARRR